MAETAARVNLLLYTNATFEDAFMFGVAGDTSWNFTGQNFRMDIKGNKDDASALLSLTSGAGQIVVDDATQRILHFNVPETVIVGALIPGEYVYDFVMYDNSSPAVRVRLMQGCLKLRTGVTGG